MLYDYLTRLIKVKYHLPSNRYKTFDNEAKINAVCTSFMIFNMLPQPGAIESLYECETGSQSFSTPAQRNRAGSGLLNTITCHRAINMCNT